MPKGKYVSDIRGRKPRKQTDEELFWSNVQMDPNGGCWLWEGPVINSGYGQFWCQASYALVLAHRWAYEKFIGPIAKGLQIDHLCHVRLCVNPYHAEPVTRKENLARSPFYRGNITHCKYGHAFTEENTYREVKWFGSQPRVIGRVCRECHRIRQARYRQEHRSAAINSQLPI
jgi:hypothetical protein